ncbi:AMP-dependent synthetase/ligase [Penicillium vulpinum]|uniref:Carrier domain-containing protein n=1 Tax=Penicillium vulpinum TaxID=29845 RepID=A0A1V6R4V1_9EURO|nr:AMP-dependent synthetase/ligase [Penicillium vulpinum]KAJ5951020.1 AMP-dependent synthetase/ligase [Penicillium vulpinum]OQD96226.1 hypothetical protein PENVUL_c094G02280 [Penicillium vulpinum]
MGHCSAIDHPKANNCKEEHTGSPDEQQLSVLREIWADILDIDVEDIDQDAHFFELGGDSLAAAELVRAAASQGMQITRGQIFTAPTFSDMVSLMSCGEPGPWEEPLSALSPFALIDSDVSLVRQLAAEQCGISPEEIEDMYPTTALQAGLMARSISVPGVYVSAWLFQSVHPVDPVWLTDLLLRVVQKLPILRTAMVTSEEHSFMQAVLPPPAAIDIIRVTSISELCLEDHKPAMTVGRPLTKFLVIVSEDCDRPYVLWYAHHATYDMSSIALVERHIADLASGEESLPAPPSFALFVAHSIEVRKSPECMPFWTEQVDDCPASIFPFAATDAPPVFRTDAQYEISFPYVGTNFGFTMANRIRAAWAFLLGCYENSEDVVFGVTNGGRYAAVPQCADIVGPAIATSPMRVRLNRESTVTEFLQNVSVQAVHINAFEQAGLANIQKLGPAGIRACSFRTLVNVQVADAGRGSNLLTPVEPGKVEPLDYALVLEPFVLGGGSKLRLRLSYDSLVIHREKVIQVAAQLKKVLRLFTTHPDRRMSEIESVPIDPRSSLGSGPLIPLEMVPRPFTLISSPAHEIRNHAAVECGVSESIVDDVYPCTPAQTRMMMVSLRHPTAYKSHIVFTPREGQSETDILHAWNNLYRRMPVLRTRFFHSPKEATSSNKRELRMLQAVVNESIQWSEWADVQQCLSADRELPFSGGQQLSRFALIRKQSGDGIREIVLTAHRSIFEPSTTQPMLRFLQEIGGQNTHDLEIMPFTSWIEGALNSLNEPSKMFWAEALEDCHAPSFPQVPATHAPLTTDTMHKTIPLPAIGSGVESPAPSATLLQLAWALTLNQYYDSNDVVFGIGVNSTYGNSRTVMGPTFSAIPQRIVFESPDMRINDLIRIVEERTEALIDHAQYDISMIREIDESCATACNFQNLLVLKSTPDDNGTNQHSGAFRTASVSTVAGKGIAGSSPHIYNFALAVEVAPLSNGVSVRMSYDPFVLKAVQVRRLMSHYENILRQMSTFNHTSTVRSIHHVPEDHLEEILSWNTVPAPRACCVHELFEAQVNSQPSSPAICARDGEWTFSQLDNAAERLARFLRSLGVGPGCYVPLLFEKCGLAIIAMLAILKAGGSSVALDPAHPKDRLQGLISGMGKCTILCSRENHILAAQVAQRAVMIDEQTLKNLSKQPLQRRLSDEEPVSAQNTAFVLFTSGSTGMPKGILIPHQAFSSSIRGHSELLRFSTGPGSRNFQFTAYTSDVSIGEIFTSLAVGSCVCVPSDWDRKNNLAGAMRYLNVNWAFFTPSVAALLVPSEVPALRTMVFGGETASPENFQTWAPALHLINSFGPAECSIWTHCIPRKVALDDLGSNIGFGVGCATWITDPTDHHRLLPIGAVGEMLVEGPNVAQGYLNDPIKTNATFVHDPAWMPPDRGSMRLYRSGDLARYLPNGMVQFLGRRDHQVKLRGLRIELGEIEHQIRKYFSDGDMLVAVDIVHPRPVGSPPILAAFIAPKEPDVLPESQGGVLNLLADKSDHICQTLHGLESALIGILPRHMVPAGFVPLRQMPLTASAKTDRRVLKNIASSVSAEELSRLMVEVQSREAPSTAMETILARLWSSALGWHVEVDRQNSFFRVGGDSLSAMRLVSFARKENVRITVEQVFQNPILRDMAQCAILDDTSAVDESNALPDVAPFSALGDGDMVASAVRSASTQLGVDAAQIEDIYPCTPLQEGLLAASQDSRGTYVAQMVHELPINIDRSRFESAWASLLEEWPILRSRFFQWHQSNGTSQLMQAVVKGRTRWVRARRLSEYLKLDRRDYMQLGDRMLRLAAFTDTGDKKQYFVMTAHHAIYDGWMLGLLFTALRRCYLGLPALETTPYRVFVNINLKNRNNEESQRFWQRYVWDSDRPSWPELPSPDFRPKPASVRQLTAQFPAGDQRNFTPSTIMRTAFAILLGAYSHSENVVFPSTVYGRTSGQSSAATVAGPTLATVPVRVRLERQSTIHEILATVQAEGAEMLAHEQEGLQNIKQYNRGALATIDTQSLLVVQVDQPSQEWNSDDFALRYVDVSGLANGFLSTALVLEATISQNELHLHMTHDDRVVAPRQAERFLEQLAHVVHQLCEASQTQLLQELDLVPQGERDEILSWNATIPKPTEALVQNLFNAQVNQQPDAEALVSWEGSLTYRQLDEFSDRLAGYLWTSCGLRAGIRVPLLFEKSIWTVVAMLAVLKIGATNAALNPAHAADHLKSLVEDIDADFILCSEQFESLAYDITPRYYCVGSSVQHLEGENCASSITPQHIAFLLFTSGSTGKPKAIMIDHLAFCSSIKGHGEVLCYRKGSRNLQFTAYTSDVSMGEIFTSLSQGATVCIPSDNERMNDLSGAMERMQVDWAFLTPSVASLLHPDQVPTLKTLVFGGETATVTNVQTWSPRLHLINSFGPAETSIWCHAHPHFTVTDDGSDVGWSVGCATWIVDPEDSSRLMPVGTIGELVVEGPNVAAGYYKNPAKTEAAFPKSLPCLPPGHRQRIYKLGDLARFLPDGRLQFLGRKDGQVKVHGQRVEVGDVENTIRLALGDNHLEVAVEMVKIPDELTGSRLIAFISCTPADQPQDRSNPAVLTDDGGLLAFQERTSSLREQLASRLSSHMIPSFFVPLTSMPLSASAKMDRKLLGALARNLDISELARFSLSSHREVLPPQSRIEKLLHSLWSSVLMLQSDEFGIEADFFECGGDSIAAMKLASLAHAAGTPLSVQDVYDHPRLGKLASAIEERSPADLLNAVSEIDAFSLLPTDYAADGLDALISKAASVCGVRTNEIVDIYPCTPIQRSMIKRTATHSEAYWLHNTFELSSEVNEVRLEQAWQAVVSLHAILRTRIFAHSGRHLQAVLSEPHTVQHVSGVSLDEFFIASRERQFTNGQPLLRASIVSYESRRYFVLKFHHAVYDAWSLTKVCELLQRQYLGSADQGNIQSMSETTIVGFNYFVKAIQQQNQSLALDFWSKYLLGAKTSSLAPSYEGSNTDSIIRHRISLPAPMATGSSTTPAIMVYAALGLALHKQLQVPDTILDLISIGRSLPLTEDLIGPTVTRVPVRINHKEQSTLHDYLSHVQYQARQPTPFEHVDLEEVARLHSDAHDACHGAPQVVVHPYDPYTEQPTAKMGLLRQELSVLNNDGIALSIDISLVLQERALEALDVRLMFDSSIVGEEKTRLLVGDLETIMLKIHALQGKFQSAMVEEVLHGVPETPFELVVERIQ